ncbi:DnaJ domain-containing protein [Nostoc sp. PCC 7107]|uniref:WD40 domain-containing protein n=1 Tax=Nostoc sp. PCC 7107 TaxID=317936 RepID=UPI00029EFE4A|nr:DnaJ domain-containing protein [Nostoc sp. PCC 7107]AFY41294.1 WD40 repeat-containing protein [Nostoc sp. PCC 7107]
MTQNSKTGAVFIAGGSLAGAGVSATVGGMGLAGGFGAVGIGTAPVVGAGAVAGAAVYGAFKAVAAGDAAAFGAMGIGAVGGAGFSGVVGGMGLVAPKIGLAFGIGTVPMASVGAVIGLAAYGFAKLLDESEVKETPAQLFARMEEKVLQMDYYNAAVIELGLFLSGNDLKQKFAALEVEEELQRLKAEFSTAKTEPETATFNLQLPETWKCVKTLQGHLGRVNAIAITPDGNTLVSGSDDKQINLWNLKTGKWLYTFSGQAEAVLSLAISPDGKQIVSGCVDRKISTWQIDKQKFLRTFFYLNSPYSHHSFVNSVIYSSDGRFITSASSDKTIRIWGGYTGDLKRTLNGHIDAVFSVAISPDSKILASGSADKTIRIWDCINWKQLEIFTEHSAAVNTLVITPDGKTLISGSTDTTIKLWNLHTRKLIQTLTGHSEAILSVAVSADGEILASSTRKTIKIWHIPTGNLLQTLPGCSPVAFTPDSQMLVSGGNGGTIKIWSLQGLNDWTCNSLLSQKWWEVLGVDANAQPQDVKFAYLQLARQYHPDVNNSATAKASMQVINQAYQKFQTQLKFK